MASMPPPRLSCPLAAHGDPNPIKFLCRNPRFIAPSAPGCPLPSFKRSVGPSPRPSEAALCRSRSSGPDPPPLAPDGGSGRRGWEYLLHDAVRSAVKRWDDYVSSYWNQSSAKGGPTANLAAGDDNEEEGTKGTKEEGIEEEIDWDWERWKRHFAEIEEEEMIVATLKSQLSDAVAREDYADAAKLKLAIATASKNDTVGTAISNLQRAIEEECYNNAAFIRDHAGAGLVGWWAGVLEDAADPYGRIIRISAEHGRYVARSYNSRQLQTGRAGLPLFEIFFTENDGDYKQQAVYLKWKSVHSGAFPKKSAKKSDSSSLNPSDNSSEGQNDKFTEEINALEERDDDSDVADGLAGIQNILRDMIPGVKVKVLKVVSSGKVDKDLIAKVIEQIMDEEDEGNDDGLESTEAEDVGPESDIEEIEMDAGDATSGSVVESSEAPMKFMIGTLMQKLSANVAPKDKVRLPARLEKRDRLSFSFSIDQDNGQRETDEKEHLSRKRSADLVMSDLAKVFLSKEKIPMKVAFRAKIGKRYQMPHRGIIPEEFGVVARYKGQGRLAEPGFQNPRWVDGELVILDGKYVRGGPVIGFVYWAPEYHFLIFFNRFRLPD